MTLTLASCVFKKTLPSTLLKSIAYSGFFHGQTARNSEQTTERQLTGPRQYQLWSSNMETCLPSSVRHSSTTINRYQPWLNLTNQSWSFLSQVWFISRQWQSLGIVVNHLFQAAKNILKTSLISFITHQHHQPSSTHQPSIAIIRPLWPSFHYRWAPLLSPCLAVMEPQ